MSTDSEQKFAVRSGLPVKLIPPEPDERYFVRRDLEEKLGKHVSTQRRVWISSPGGSGKTSLVKNFLSKDPRPLIWYQVDKDDRDPANLFFYLAQAVDGDQHYEQPLPQLTAESIPNLEAFSRRFCRLLFERIGSACVLVFDNLQEGPGESVFGPFFSALMAELPQDSALLIISREELYPSFARECLNQALACLGWEDLCLSSDETRRFLQWSHDKEPLPQQVDLACELTQGWIAGLLLLEPFAEEAGPEPISMERTDLLFSYFAGEIFSAKPAEIQEFLVLCALLPSVDIGMAEQLTARGDAGDLLRGLVRLNHFTSRISSRPEIFRFHPLFREFLLSNAERTLQGRQLASCLEHAASLLVQDGQIESAAELMVHAKAWPSLQQLINSEAETLLSQGRLQTLLQWLEALPTALRNQDPWLCYWRGNCLLAKNPDEALLELTRAFDHFERIGDAVGSMRSWSMVVNAIVIVWDDYGEMDRWIERFDRLIDRFPHYPSREIERLMVQGICKSLAWRQPSRPDLPEWADRLFSLVTTSRDSDYRLLAGSNLVLYHIVSGEIAVAQSLVALLNSDLHSSSVSPLKKLIWLATRCALEWVLMDRPGCLSTIEEGQSIIEESGVHVIDMRLYGQGITLGLTSGDFALVEQLLEALPPTPIGTAMDHAHHASLLADLSLSQGDTAKGVALADTAIQRAQESGNLVMMAFCLPGSVLALYRDGQMERAAELLEKGLDLSVGMNFFRSYLQLIAAFFALENGHEEVAHGLMREGFAVAARQGYLNFQPWRDEIMRRLCREAIVAGIETEYVTRLASLRKLDITAPDTRPLTPKESETLRWVQEGKTNWEIATILGVNEGTVKFHIRNVLQKLGASTRAQAVAIALKSGQLEND